MATTKSRRSTDRLLPVPRAKLLELGLTDKQVDDALARRPRYVACSVRKVRGAWFDVAAVKRVLKALRALRHTKAKWANQPLDPTPWQIVWVIAPVFGWKSPRTREYPRGLRIIRTVWDELPRRNGKSTIASGLGLVLFAGDGEPGAEVYAAATDRAQAGIVFGDAKAMAVKSPALKGRIVPLAQLMRHPRSNSIFRALSKVSEAAHGLNVHGGVIDEVHVHRTRDLIDAIETGTGSRAQPLILFITTADDGDDTTIYAEKHNYCVGIAEGTLEADPEFYGVIWAADPSDDPFDEKTWAKANPGLGVSPTFEYMRGKARKARATPSFFPTFCRLHLNLRMKTDTRWISLPQWDRNQSLLDENALKGRDCYGGLDLASSKDFTAWVLLFPPADGDPDGGRWKVLPRLWLPRAAVEARGPLRSTLVGWEDEGFITVTDGDVVDYDTIEAQIARDVEDFHLLEAVYDKWNAPQLVNRLVEAGLTVWPLEQTIGQMSAPSKELERLLGLNLINHGGHPVLRWMASNAVVRTDHNANIKPDKTKSTEKIDGISALVMAIAAALREREEQSEPGYFSMRQLRGDPDATLAATPGA